MELFDFREKVLDPYKILYYSERLKYFTSNLNYESFICQKKLLSWFLSEKGYAAL